MKYIIGSKESYAKPMTYFQGIAEDGYLMDSYTLDRAKKFDNRAKAAVKAQQIQQDYGPHTVYVIPFPEKASDIDVKKERTMFGNMPVSRTLFKASQDPEGWPLIFCGNSAEDSQDWHVTTVGLKADQVPEDVADAKSTAHLVAKLLNAFYNKLIRLD